VDAQQYRPLVTALFPSRSSSAARPRGVALEQELVTADARTGAVVEVGRLLEATRGASYAEYLSVEPGGQVELSVPVASGPAALVRSVLADLAALRADCGRAGIVLVAAPVDVREEEVPLQLRSPRYLAMAEHFDRIGPAGRVMMRRTASTQVCVDWSDGSRGVEQWRVLNLAAPFLAAAFARRTGPGSRLATWLEVDPSRTAFDGRLLVGRCPVAAYADFAAGATPFVEEGAAHLTTLFPPVRPRGRYLEVRFPDVQEDDAIGRHVSSVAALVLDDAVRGEALRRLEGEAGRLERHWVDAAHGDGDAAARGHALVALALGAPAASASLRGAA
jgi:glutamate--cysteine ligase